MRFFTVADAASARRSVFYATCCVAYFCLVIPLLGFGAIALLMQQPGYFVQDAAGHYDRVKDLIGGANMAAIHLSGELGGPVLMGLISAVAFATILAVVAGLTLAGASAISHDIYGQVVRAGRAGEGREVLVSRLAAIGIGVVAVLFALGVREPERRLHGGPVACRRCQLQCADARHGDLLAGGDNARDRRRRADRPGLLGRAGDCQQDRLGQRLPFRSSRSLPTTTRPCSRCRSRLAPSGCCRCPTAASAQRTSGLRSTDS